MKKSIFLMLLLAVAGSANAELVLKTKEYLGIVPAAFTTSGKSVVYTYNGNDEVTIYSPDFLVEKTIRIARQEYLSGDFTEEATVNVTGMNAVPKNSYGYDNYSKSYWFDADSQEEMINELNEWDDRYIAFTDPMGNPACYDPDHVSFMYKDLFGEKYPKSWFALIDGAVYDINVYNDFYSLAYDEASAVWTRTKEPGTSTTSLQEYHIKYEGMNYDAYRDIYITQTVFNDDDKWEYIMSDESGIPGIHYYEPTVKEINEYGGVLLERRGYYFTSGNSRYAVYNEDGEKLGNISDDNICILNGKPYTIDEAYYEGSYESSRYESFMYSFDSDGGDDDFIEAVKAKGERRLDARRGIVTVDISSEQAGGEVIVSTTDGKVLAGKRVEAGQTQVNEQPLPAGIYVVSLLKDGRVVESEKYLVQ